MNFPPDIANEALLAAGTDFVIGDMEEGTDAARIILRKYGQCLRALSRAAHWDGFRKMAPMTLLADASGQTANVGTIVADPTFMYEYSLPLDCLLPRFVPWNALSPTAAVPATNIQVAPVPQTSAQQAVFQPGMRLIPAPYLMTTDTNYPGDFTNPAWIDFPGVSPSGRIVICTNVQQASLVYTAFIPYPNMWSSDFRQAFVAYLASEVALALARDKKFGMQLRDDNIKIARQKIGEARVTAANDASQPQSTDIIPDYIRIRGSGVGTAPWWGGPGWSGLGCGGIGYGSWCSIGFANGSVF